VLGTMEPTPEQAAEGSILVKVLAAVLERLVNSNTVLARSDPGQITKFHALKPPGIGIEAYLERIHKYASCSNECFILALIYIDRLIQRNNFLLTELNVHRVVITAILLAAKFFDDAYYNNAYYSKVGGVLVSEMNGLEVDFLFRINFSLHVQPDVFDKYKAELVAHSINCGLALSPVSAPLPQIAEMEPPINYSGMTEMIQQQQQQQQRQQFPVHTSAIHTAAPTMSMMARPPQVTPSPNSNQDMNATSMNCNHVTGPLQAPPPAPPGNPMAVPVMVSNSNMQSLYVPNEANEHQQQTMMQHQQPTADGCGSAFTSQQQQIEQRQQALLQRANSLPPLFSSGRCVDHARKPPYHSAPTPMAPMLPIMTVDQEQYQMMMNQLFPIQTTLMHHNHAVTSDHHVVHNNNHHQGYSGIHGSGIGSLVAHY